MPDSTTAASTSSGVVVLSPLHIVWLCRSTRTHPGGHGSARGGWRSTATCWGAGTVCHATGAGPGGPRRPWSAGGAYAPAVAVRQSSWWRPRRARSMLVTGGTGFLGRHLAESPGAQAWSWVAPSSHLLDLRDRARVLDHVGEWKPNVIVHLAYRRDDAASIVAASANVAEAAAACRARLVHLSSDVVFAGRELPYVETDRPDAVMDYGRWKAEAERRVLAVCRNVVLVRTSLLYGTSRLAPWQRAIRDRQPVTWFTDEIR